ncbi:hypothetical protein AWJ20_2027 [Sugiyamaella lignohabitans]|uniref:Gamma tubulin complex component C-terminal domain-containing protein n=1 Tax=Sugiyamaella lignohabitans TaxID=796027 RepID=A0A167ETL5_9ASCO|nr:uncharacterized protein AWJ20_2027 [Sugiyamaella lignohabitans]ANB14438.1 hypothetical protein AWJ20_2027 [Sugiyamaella lignohabitans]
MFLKYDPDTDLLKLDLEQIPVFLHIRLAQLVLESLNCFIVVARYGSEELKSQMYQLDPNLVLEWRTNFAEILELRKAVQVYEEKSNAFGLSRVLWNKQSDLTPRSVDVDTVNFFDVPSQYPSIPSINASLDRADRSHKGDIVEKIVDGTLFGTLREARDDELPIEMVAQLSFAPIIRTQWKLANKLVMRIFKGEQDIVDHARLIEQTYFLANGELAIRLEERIFGTTTQGGLALDAQHFGMEISGSWQPTSLEINSCLSGVLEDVIRKLPGVCNEVRQAGFINFGFSEKNRQQSNLFATSVLKLTYRVPKPLSLIFNSKAIYYLDKIFQRLIMGLRLTHWLKMKRHGVYCVQNQQLRNFISCSLSSINLAIRNIWEALINKLVVMNVEEETSLEQVISEVTTALDRIFTNMISGPEEELLFSIYSVVFEPTTDDDKLRKLIVQLISQLQKQTIQANTDALIFTRIFTDQLQFSGFYERND